MSAEIKIHPTAIVHPKAQLDSGVEVGPYAIIDEHVQIGRGTTVDAHAVLRGHTTIGQDNRIGVGAVIGLEPQDVAYKNEKSFTKIGNKNIFREYVQVHRGTKEGTVTVVGDNNFLLGLSHVAHNCQLGNNIILANGALLAGYAEVGDFVFISGNCLVHQFTKIGKMAMMRGGSGISLDLPPYCVADGNNMVRGLNTVGLERRGFTVEQIRSVKKAYRDVFSGERPLVEQVKEMLSRGPSPEVTAFLEFIRDSERGVCRPQ